MPLPLSSKGGNSTSFLQRISQRGLITAVLQFYLIIIKLLNYFKLKMRKKIVYYSQIVDAIWFFLNPTNSSPGPWMQKLHSGCFSFCKPEIPCVQHSAILTFKQKPADSNNWVKFIIKCQVVKHLKYWKDVHDWTWTVTSWQKCHHYIFFLEERG